MDKQQSNQMNKGNAKKEGMRMDGQHGHEDGMQKKQQKNEKARAGRPQGKDSAR